MSAPYWMCLLCIMCFVFSLLPLQTNFPWEHEHMSSYSNSYNNITRTVEDFVLSGCIWELWQGAILKAKSRIKGAEFHMKHSSAQEQECRNVRNSFWKAVINGLKVRKHKADKKQRQL